ncbi:MAG: 50S ribosomal protein L25 [Anaerolineae bacterium]
MAEKYVLEATRRELTGKKVKQMRERGLIPAVLYGPAFEALPLQVSWSALRPVLRDAGGTHLIELNVDGERHNALVRQVQRDPIRGDVLHVDFFRVRMDVAIRTEVPVVLVGNADAIEDAGGVINHEMTHVLVECLPADLPAEIQVDLSVLREVGDSIVSAQLPALPGVTYLVEGNEVVVSTSFLEAAEEEEEAGVEEMAEPELIRRPSDEEEEEE